MNKKYPFNVRVVLLIGALLFLLQSCNFPLAQGNSFNKQVATQAAFAFTQTAEQSQMLTANAPTTPTPAISAITPTSDLDDPKAQLGSAAWQDSLTSGNSFGVGNTEEQISGTNATVWVKEGSFNMYRPTASGGYIWYCAYPNIADFYLEATFTVQNSNGTDEYGLFIRKPDFTDNSGYYFIVTGEGKFNLMRWTASGSTLLGEWKTDENIIKGPDATNTLGIWAEGNTIRLYINDHFAGEFNDTLGWASGYFGLFTNARQTAGMLVKMDEITYWNLP